MRRQLLKELQPGSSRIPTHQVYGDAEEFEKNESLERVLCVSRVYCHRQSVQPSGDGQPGRAQNKNFSVSSNMAADKTCQYGSELCPHR